jgi:hypothetical protein
VGSLLRMDWEGERSKGSSSFFGAQGQATSRFTPTLEPANFRTDKRLDGYKAMLFTTESLTYTNSP